MITAELVKNDTHLVTTGTDHSLRIYERKQEKRKKYFQSI